MCPKPLQVIFQIAMTLIVLIASNVIHKVTLKKASTKRNMISYFLIEINTKMSTKFAENKRSWKRKAESEIARNRCNYYFEIFCLNMIDIFYCFVFIFSASSESQMADFATGSPPKKFHVTYKTGEK